MEERHGFYPWRRYLARITDMGLYGFLWTVVSTMAFSIRRTPGSTLGFQILDFLVTVLLMLALEPVFLAVWGTTPGKRIFGITVRRKDGERLSYEQGLFRTWRVFSSGMGFDIPVYNLFRMYKNYQICRERKELDWDEECLVKVQDEKCFRWLVFVLVQGMLLGGTVLVVLLAQVVPNLGAVTVAEFAENYNDLTKYFYSEHKERCLNENGMWEEETPFSDSVTIWIGNRTLPEFQYQTENGIVTAVSFSIELLDQKEPVSGYETQMALAALSFAAGRQGTGGFLQNFRPILYEIEENGKRDWSFCTEDVEISWRREIKGYHEEAFSNGLTVYFPKEDAAHTCYRMDFQMKLIK